MFQHTRLNSDQNFFQKVKNLDYILILLYIIMSMSKTNVNPNQNNVAATYVIKKGDKTDEIFIQPTFFFGFIYTGGA